MKKIYLSFLIIAGAAKLSTAQSVTISPANATGDQQLTLTLDVNTACSDSPSPINLSGGPCRIHSGVGIDPDPNNDAMQWQHVVQMSDPTAMMTDAGGGMYTITMVPRNFYSVPVGETIYRICCVFNGGPTGSEWDQRAKCAQGDPQARPNCSPTDPCCDFYIPLVVSGINEVQDLIYLSSSPNPLSSSTAIKFSLMKNYSDVNLKVYDLLGNCVKTIAGNQNVVAHQNYSYIWNGDNDKNAIIANGIYFIRLEANGKVITTQRINVDLEGGRHREVRRARGPVLTGYGAH